MSDTPTRKQMLHAAMQLRLRHPHDEIGQACHVVAAWLERHAARAEEHPANSRVS